MTMESSKTVQ